jgi:tryptophan-rich sensory protein
MANTTTMAEPTRPLSIPRLIMAVLACQAAGGLGAIFTAQSRSDWYPTLRKPPFNPPGSVFGPVWTLLYMLMGIAFDLVSRREANRGAVRQAQAIFGLQLILNTLWSALFFGRRSPLAALVEIILLWFAIVLTVVLFGRVSKLAALLLLPYLAWVSFAAVLNGAIWRLNA